ncbi:MAG: hypothetical protein AB2551_11025 [Candidatus Thiodiazotropha sp.]
MPKPRKEQTFPFTLRLTVSERRFLEKKAGNLSLGEYIRLKALGESRVRRSSKGMQPLKGQPILSKLLGTLGGTRIASNISQLATAVDQGYVTLPPQAGHAIYLAHADIKEIKTALLQSHNKSHGTIDQARLERLSEEIGDLRAAGILNELSKAANSGSLVIDPETTMAILEACADIRDIKDTFTRALHWKG